MKSGSCGVAGSEVLRRPRILWSANKPQAVFRFLNTDIYKETMHVERSRTGRKRCSELLKFDRQEVAGRDNEFSERSELSADRPRRGDCQNRYGRLGNHGIELLLAAAHSDCDGRFQCWYDTGIGNLSSIVHGCHVQFSGNRFLFHISPPSGRRRRRGRLLCAGFSHRKAAIQYDGVEQGHAVGGHGDGRGVSVLPRSRHRNVRSRQSRVHRRHAADCLHRRRHDV